ncbi:redox-regulated ATPase YchF [Liberiplasma polymorphum]|uniref:redox-regulated ATPase YchF n=1 Tax=Liberiplasma polymorphum TaxID=3374570 RepID=UPI003773181F
MALTAGIVGLPNVGKSTLFNAITNAGALAANYPFATIEPNVGTVIVPDERLYKISDIVNPKKIVPTTFEFTDIAGLVKGASKGEGLGNQFLSHIREVDAIIHVVRCFEDENVTHVDGDVDSIRDIETIDIELIFSDLEIVEKRLPKIEKKAQLKLDQNMEKEFELLKLIHETLMDNRPIRSILFNKEELSLIKGYGFLTQKPVIYVCNISEEDFSNNHVNAHAQSVIFHAENEKSEALLISAKIEAELSELEVEEKAMYLEELGIEQTGLDQLIKRSYEILGLQTFFTAGEKEVRAWTFKKGMKAPECAGVIHSDFQKGFIRAETISYQDLLDTKSMVAAKEHGKMRSEGKSYEVKDGDIMLFRFNV